MPAYRSPAEGEIRDAVVARLRECRPGARIIHEINVSTFGPNRIDLIAVDTAEIIAVEIKSKRDKLDRLDAQVASMRRIAHTVVAAVHEKFLVEQKTHAKARHYERDGEPFLRCLPDNWKSVIETWVFPKIRRSVDPDWHDHLEQWSLPPARLEAPLPSDALGMLWREELAMICDRLRVSVGRRATMVEMVAALRWHCTGKELTLAICQSLRTRRCVEADPEIITRAAA